MHGYVFMYVRQEDKSHLSAVQDGAGAAPSKLEEALRALDTKVGATFGAERCILRDLEKKIEWREAEKRQRGS